MTRARSVRALELLLLERAQQLGLTRERELADLVEKQRPFAGRFERARARGHRARERASLVAEELALEEGLGDRGAVDDAQRLARAGARFVDEAREEGFADARLAVEKDGDVRGGQLWNPRGQLQGGRRRAEEMTRAAEGERPERRDLLAGDRRAAGVRERRAVEAPGDEEHSAKRVAGKVRRVGEVKLERRRIVRRRGHAHRRLVRALRHGHVLAGVATHLDTAGRPEQRGPAIERGGERRLVGRGIERLDEIVDLRHRERVGADARCLRLGVGGHRLGRRDRGLGDDAEDDVADDDPIAHLGFERPMGLSPDGEGGRALVGLDQDAARGCGDAHVPARDGEVAQDEVGVARAANAVDVAPDEQPEAVVGAADDFQGQRGRRGHRRDGDTSRGAAGQGEEPVGPRVRPAPCVGPGHGHALRALPL
jgi:hypothetical protein